MSFALFALRPHPAPGLGTMAVTEGWLLLYDPATVLEWHAGEAPAGTGRGHDGVAAAVFHEVGHVLRGHFARRGGRDPRAWNEAGDREINDDVLKAGWRLPGQPLLPAQIGMDEGLLAEEYYRERPGEPRGVPGCGGACGGAAGNPSAWEREHGDGKGGASGGSSPPASGEGGPQAPSPCDPLEQEIVLRRTARDVRRAVRSAGKGTVPAGLAAWAESKLAPPEVDWRRKLAGLVRRALAATAGASDWTWRRSGRRSLHSAGRAGWPLAPAYHQPTPSVGVVLDTSGSMSCEGSDGRTLQDEALSEVLGIARAAGAECWAVACDAQAYDVVPVRRQHDLDRLNRGGGGTMMQPGFLKVVAARHPDLVVIVTDGQVGGDWPSREQCRGTRVLAAVVGGGPKAPEWIETVEVS